MSSSTRRHSATAAHLLPRGPQQMADRRQSVPPAARSFVRVDTRSELRQRVHRRTPGAIQIHEPKNDQKNDRDRTAPHRGDDIARVDDEQRRQLRHRPLSRRDTSAAALRSRGRDTRRRHELHRHEYWLSPADRARHDLERLGVSGHVVQSLSHRLRRAVDLNVRRDRERDHRADECESHHRRYFEQHEAGFVVGVE